MSRLALVRRLIAIPARPLLACAAALTLLGGAALLGIDRGGATNVATTAQQRFVPHAEAVSEPAASDPSTTVAVTTTGATRRAAARPRSLPVPHVPKLPAVPNVLPLGWVAFEQAEGLVAVRTDASRRVTVSQPGEKVLGAAWSPLVNELAYVVENSAQLRVVNVDTGAARTFDLGAPPWNSTFVAPTWSPTGTVLVINTTSSLVKVSLVTGEVRSLGARLDDAMSFSPDGMFIAGRVTGCSYMSCQDKNLTVVPVAGGDRRTIATTSGFWPRSPLWSNDGTRIAFVVGKDSSATSTAVIGVDGNGEHVVAAPDTPGVGLSGATPATWDPLVPTALFMHGQPTGIRYANVDGGPVTSIGPQGPSMPGEVSPNGLLVAYGASCNGVYAACLYEVDRTGANERLLANTIGVGVAGFTPDSLGVITKETVDNDWSKAVAHSVTGDRTWVLSDRLPNNVLTPDAYLYVSRALL